MQLLSVTVMLTVPLLCRAASIGNRKRLGVHLTFCMVHDIVTFTVDGGSTSPKYGVTAQQAGDRLEVSTTFLSTTFQLICNVIKMRPDDNH